MKRIRQRAIGSFARQCLAPASKHCEGKKGSEFQRCREQFIERCKREKGF